MHVIIIQGQSLQYECVASTQASWIEGVGQDLAAETLK